MTYKATVTTADLEVQFWEKSFKIKGIAQTVYLDRLSDNTQRNKIANTMQEIYDRGRGVRHTDKLPKSIPVSDVRKVTKAEPKDNMHHEVGEAMEALLERLDNTYGREDLTEEKQYQIRCGIMAGVISAALDRGRVRGLDEAVDRLKKTILGEATV
jgi:hypothetical protein